MNLESEATIYKVSNSVEVLVGPPREEDDHGIEHATATPLTFRYANSPNALPVDQAPSRLRKEIVEFYENYLAPQSVTAADQTDSL